MCKGLDPVGTRRLSSSSFLVEEYLEKCSLIEFVCLAKVDDAVLVLAVAERGISLAIGVDLMLLITRI